MKALIVEDSQVSLTVVSRVFSRMNIEPIPARDGAEGLMFFESEKPDLVLLDIVLPRIDGIEVARRIRASETDGEWTPIIFFTGRTKDDDVAQGIAVGGDDYLVKPVSETVLAAKVRAMLRIMHMRDRLLDLTRKHEQACQELQRLSSVDPLTGIGNRRALDESLEREWRRCVRTGQVLSLLLCDVDYFKRYNDTYGHHAGDECLWRVAQLLSAQLRRPADLVARYGGEEFAVILPETDCAGANLMAERLRAAVEALALPHLASECSSVVTLSVGVATHRPNRGGDLAQSLLLPVDKALYGAKNAGRNRVGTCVEEGAA